MSKEIEDQSGFFHLMKNNHFCKGENCSICQFFNVDESKEPIVESYRIIILDYSNIKPIKIKGE